MKNYFKVNSNDNYFILKLKKIGYNNDYFTYF